ncbi:hypothetical protein [Streptomyces sp. NPDC018610]|uniref:aromatic-ring hydroxylase C-terminal domain-containing protein n=1 Tax=Streptomyces sp. NPDC018610 TaxID=3365049 RepID=UPI0037B497EC
MPPVEEFEPEPQQRGQRTLPRRPAPHGPGEDLHRLGDPVEEQVLLAREVVEDDGDRLDVLTARCPARPGLAALLVRPDGFVCWAADTEPAAPGADPLPKALERWLGTPAPRA